MVFLDCSAESFNGFVVGFLCVWYSCKNVKNACFSSLGAFVGWLILVYLGLEGLGVYVVLVLLFFCSGFVFVFWLCFCFVVGLLLVLFLFCFFSLKNVFGGFKGQVRWPTRPPHLVLNPPYVFVFSLLSFICFPFFAFSLFSIEKLCFPP